MKLKVGSLVAAALLGSMLAQPAAGEDKLLRAPYIAPSGATVDKPGQPQASGPTPLDRGIQRQDEEIDHSICRGC